MRRSVRVAAPQDVLQISAIYDQSVAASPASFEIDPPGAAEMQRRLETTLERYPWLVCEDGGAVAGYVYASQHRPRLAYRWSVDVAVYVAEEYRRTGVGARLYTALFRLLALQGFYNAYAGITLPNEGSVRLHENHGFRSVGVNAQAGYKFGAWHDVGWWQLRLRPVENPPPEPISFPELKQIEDWEECLKPLLPISDELPSVDRSG